MYVSDTPTGGDCILIGVWTAETKTCTLSSDLSQESIYISDGLTIDGNGHTISNIPRHEVGIILRNNATIKNAVITGWSQGIFSYSGNVIENNKFLNNNFSATLDYRSKNNIFKGNTFANSPYGVYASESNGNIFEGNIFQNISFENLYLKNSNNLIIKGNTVHHGYGAVRIDNTNGSQIYNNNFFSAGQEPFVILSGNNVFDMGSEIGGNYWERYDNPSEGCNDDNSDGFCDDRLKISGSSSSYDNFPFTKPDGWTAPPVLDCCSNVLFLPGFMASDLYVQESLFENQLWPPTSLLKTDVEKLMLDSSGNPVTLGIYTKGIMNEAFGFNIYKSLIEKMDSMVANGEIKEWEGFPYDWRKDIGQVVNEDTIIKVGNNFENKKLINEAVALAERSPTGKITIVGHSNGGLVGKSLIKELANIGKTDIIDQFVMVATPQIGTPKALAGLLHGDQQEIPPFIGILMNKELARELGYDMQSAHNLLPTESYFNTISDPVITFQDSINQIFDYSVNGLPQYINTYDNMLNFVTSTKNSSSFEEPTNVPSILKTDLVNKANMNIGSITNWQIPPNIKVTEIAGWGEQTIKGVDYLAKQENMCVNENELYVCGPKNIWDRRLVMTNDGDGTVVLPSGTYYSTQQKYYFNLFDFNSPPGSNLKHHNILEAPQLLETLSKILAENLDVLPKFISTQKPISSNQTLQLSVHSPVSLGVTDAQGKYTGPSSITPTDAFTFIKEEIPNSYYLEIGEDKYIGLPKNGSYSVNMEGTGVGTFTFNQEITQNNQIIDSKSFIDIPVIPQTLVYVSIDDGNLSTNLNLDIDGNGSIDTQIQASNEFDSLVYLETMKYIVKTFNLNKSQENNIINKIDSLIKFIQDGKIDKASDKAKIYVKKLNSKFQKLNGDIKRNDKKLTEEEIRIIMQNLEEFITNLK